ncbi:MAG: mechanosensitive ion channel family protein [Acidobacteria bacterium]|nr:mechanosensitive ion channel family protein [Acidobacteriota bacterium]
MEATIQYLMNHAVDFGLKLLGALALWIVGGWLIKFLLNNLLSRGMSRQKVDATVIGYVVSALTVLLKIVLAIAILGFLGLPTTTFAALIAAAGLAIGMAWSGLLSNFAAGAFLMILRPFKAGDFVSSGGVIGTVEEVGLFVTTINTMDNIRTFVGNNKIFSDTIQNFSANPFRRVDLVAQLSHKDNPSTAIVLLKERLAKVANVIAAPAPDVEILTFTPMGPVLAVRPYVHNDHYWQVYFDTNKVISEAGFAVPEQHFQVKQT